MYVSLQLPFLLSVSAIVSISVGLAVAEPGMCAAPLRFRMGSNSSLYVSLGDLTRWKGDAVVNAANERMLGGGGVDGAIHRAAGPDLRAACLKVPQVLPDVRCPTGDARITPGFDLPARHVIHTVGPVYHSPEESAPLLRSAYRCTAWLRSIGQLVGVVCRSSLALANEHELQTIAFPAISCGVFGYPLDEAAEIALATCVEHHGSLQEVHFVLFGDKILQAWLQAAHELQLQKQEMDMQDATCENVVLGDCDTAPS